MMRVWNHAWIGESESISIGALKEGMGPFVRQDELSMQRRLRESAMADHG
jgi:hypothetical protein